MVTFSDAWDREFLKQRRSASSLISKSLSEKNEMILHNTDYILARYRPSERRYTFDFSMFVSSVVVASRVVLKSRPAYESFLM